MRDLPVPSGHVAAPDHRRCWLRTSTRSAGTWRPRTTEGAGSGPPRASARGGPGPPRAPAPDLPVLCGHEAAPDHRRYGLRPERSGPLLAWLGEAWSSRRSGASPVGRGPPLDFLVEALTRLPSEGAQSTRPRGVAPWVPTIWGAREKQTEVAEARLKLEQAKLESAWKGVEQRRQELVEVSERQAAVNSELDKMKSRLVEREASAKALRDSAARQAATLKVREDWVKSREAGLAEQEKQLLAERAALEQLKQGAAQQAAVEDREQMRAGLQRIADWAGEASSALVPLGLSPIRVTEPPSTIADALPVLDSAVERLRRLDSTLGERLEAEGRELCRLVVEHLLVCFRSHDPAISLDPVIAGPVEEMEAAARVSVQEAVEVVAARFQRTPADEDPDVPGTGASPAP
ncbi:hypothetical protein BS78_08G169100 [Paspalum vaginatum]|nr:hypothetical protein BS78_08G169100 [Paspalum vaginatum]